MQYLKNNLFILLTMIPGALVAQVSLEHIQEAPLPELILEAESIFLINGGGKDPAVKGDSAQLVYDVVYNEIAEWGYYKFADSPADADLVIYVSYNAENQRERTYTTSNFYTGQTQTHSKTVADPTLRLTIIDIDSGLKIWEFTELRKKSRTWFGLGQKKRVKNLIDAAKRLAISFRDRVDAK